MDKMLNLNVLDTVQLVSIFSYLNSLSDFLFIEYYLTEDDQYKQIPVVNALYKYLEDSHDDPVMKLILIRKLLQGSDLYGENDDEKLDDTFTNAMFEYIISSLVFDKYGNVYGFLADVVYNAKSKRLNSLYKEILDRLKNATFENEYGEKSSLTTLAANRIFTDIIMPLFPQTETNPHVLSLDYIYAQAGLVFLRTVTLDTTFRTDLKNNISCTNCTQKNDFEEYVVLGHLLRNSLNNKNISFVSYKAFTLPALFYFVSTVNLGNDNVRDMFDPLYLKSAYDLFFSHLNQTFDEIDKKLEEDTKYQIHIALSEFKNRPTIAQSYLDQHNELYKEEERSTKINNYLQFPTSTKCDKEHLLPNLTEQFMRGVNHISEMYRIHDLKIMKQAFGISFLRFLKYASVVIQLLAPDDKVISGVFDKKMRMPYDLFVFYYPENSTAYFYALIRENFTAIFIKEDDDPKRFGRKTGVTIYTLLAHRYHRINLKTAEQTMDEFWDNFLTYKQNRLKSYLNFLNTNSALGEWWKEFGLPLVPFYSCMKEQNGENKEENVCVMDEINFSHIWNEDISTKLTNSNTRSFLTSLGTTFKIVQIFSTIKNKYDVRIEEEEETDIYEVMEKLALHFKDPGFFLTFMDEQDIILIQTVLNTLMEKVDNSFQFVTNSLNKMKSLKETSSRLVIYYEGKKGQYMRIKTENVFSDTAYGYKFKYLSHNQTIQLRTDYQLKKKIFVSLLSNVDNETLYTEVDIENPVNQSDARLLYESDHHIQSISTRVKFVGLSVNNYNLECDFDQYIEHSIPLSGCRRGFRALEKLRNFSECVKFVMSNNTNLKNEQVLKILKKYTFPDEGRIDLEFVKDWMNTTDLNIPKWGENYIINNSPLLTKLREEFHLDVRNISNFDGRLKIDSIYVFNEIQKIQNGVSIESIIKDFNDQQARYVATFEDYYAIRNFATTGYTRITGDTNEAKLMKTALYKLAIRQSDDPDEEFELKLFKIESKTLEFIDRTIISKNRIIFNKFTTAYPIKKSALLLAVKPANGYKNILYKINYSTAYVRAKIKELHLTNSKEVNRVILLPGSEFDIKSYKEININGLGSVLAVTLTYVYKTNDKFNWFKNIMNEIDVINSKNT